MTISSGIWVFKMHGRTVVVKTRTIENNFLLLPDIYKTQMSYQEMKSWISKLENRCSLDFEKLSNTFEET
jgi:hypothetical protein